MYTIFILFYLLINVNTVKNLELKHVPPENKSYILEEGEVQDGDNKYLMGSTHEMHKLLKSEIEFAQDLKSYLKLLQDQVSKVETFMKLNKYTDDFNEENLGDLENMYSILLMHME